MRDERRGGGTAGRDGGPAPTLARARSRLTHPGFRRLHSRPEALPAGSLVAAALLSAALLPLDPPAVQAQEIDAGRLNLRIDGRRVGTERFRVWLSGSAVNASAAIEVAERPARRTELQMDPGLRPAKYLMRDDAAATVSGERFPDRLRVHVSTPEGERWKEYPADAAGAIFERGVTHHYLLLVRALRDAPGGRLEALLPLAGRLAPVRLATQSDEPVAIEEASVAATRFDLEIEGALHHVWLDADGRLLRALDPGTGLEAVRSQIEN